MRTDQQRCAEEFGFLTQQLPSCSVSSRRKSRVLGSSNTPAPAGELPSVCPMPSNVPSNVPTIALYQHLQTTPHRSANGVPVAIHNEGGKHRVVVTKDLPGDRWLNILTRAGCRVEVGGCKPHNTMKPTISMPMVGTTTAACLHTSSSGAPGLRLCRVHVHYWGMPCCCWCVLTGIQRTCTQLMIIACQDDVRVKPTEHH